MFLLKILRQATSLFTLTAILLLVLPITANAVDPKALERIPASGKFSCNICDFSGANLTAHPNIKNGQFFDGNFNGANMAWMDLSGIQLVRSDLRYAKLKNANLSGAEVSDSSFEEADLEYAQFTGASLTNVFFNKSELGASKFDNATLKRIEWSKADLDSASFTNAKMAGTDLSKVSDLRRTNFTGADLSNANLTEVNMTNAVLARANLAEANLQQAILHDVNLEEANLTKAVARRANMIGVRFGAANFTDAKFGSADIRPIDTGTPLYCRTETPDGEIKSGPLCK